MRNKAKEGRYYIKIKMIDCTEVRYWNKKDRKLDNVFKEFDVSTDLHKNKKLKLNTRYSFIVF